MFSLYCNVYLCVTIPPGISVYCNVYLFVTIPPGISVYCNIYLCVTISPGISVTILSKFWTNYANYSNISSYEGLLFFYSNSYKSNCTFSQKDLTMYTIIKKTFQRYFQPSSFFDEFFELEVQQFRVIFLFLR